MTAVRMDARDADRAFGTALQGRGFGRNGEGAPKPPGPRVPLKLREGAIELGRASNGDVVGLHLGKAIEGRLLIQGNSGAGKSMLLRRLFEQSVGQVQQLVIDIDGEFSTLAENFDVAVFNAEDALRVGGGAFALHLREHRYSAVLDLSDATSEQQLTIIADIATGLVESPRELWHPLLVHVDETQRIAPRTDPGDVDPATRKRTIAALVDLMGRGRKRGLAGVIATARLAETATAVASKATNIIVGRTIFDRDLERSGSSLGYTAGHSKTLRTLADGEFMCLGPALGGPTRLRFKTGSVQSRHKGDAPPVETPPTLSAASAAALLRQVPARVEPTVEVAAPSPIVVGAKLGRRGIDWRPEWDALIRDCYANSVPIAVIGERLSALGLQVTTSTISMRAHSLGLVSFKASVQWSDAEDDIIRTGYEGEGRIMDIVTALAEAGFSRSRVAVQMRAIALGVTRDRVNYWKPEESEIALAGLNAGKSTREIIMALKAAGYERGVTGVTKFAQKHGISRNSAIPWADTDLATLTEMYTGNKSVAEIMQALDRSRGAILSMASQLGLKQRKPWTDEEKAKLRRLHADGIKLLDCATRFPGRTYATVARMAAQMRLDFRGRTAAPTKTRTAAPKKTKEKTGSKRARVGTKKRRPSWSKY